MPKDTKRFTVKPPKKLKSLPPDVVITVGSGDDKKDFECYSVILRHASDFFDAMLSHPVREAETSRVELPDKDPEEWELVYQFIDPAQPTPVVDLSNVLVLAPWFHFLQMTEYTKMCDEYFARYILVNRFFQVDTRHRYECRDISNVKGRANRLLEYFEFCEDHLQEKSINSALDQIADALHNSKYDILLRENYIELIQQIADIFDRYKEKICKNLKHKTHGNPFQTLYDHVVQDVKEIDWEDKYCRLLIKERLKNLKLTTTIKKLETKIENMQTELEDCKMHESQECYFDY